MTFLAPGFLIAAGLAALGVVALHLLSTRDPKLELLPTTRFLPDLSVRATATTVRPTDPWLLLLRVALLLLVGTALAGPVITPPRQAVARIVGIDVSRAVGDPAELVDSAGAYLPGAAAVILFDSAAVELRAPAEDSLRARLSAPGERPRGSLSAALVAARRAAARLRDRADSMELVIISPFVVEARDAATDTLRDLWPGRIRPVRVAASAGPERGDSVVLAWADSADTADWVARSPPDTIAGLRLGDVVVVHPFARRWRLARGGAARARVLARWLDGEPAAVERYAANGCLRSLGFALPAAGDALLRPSVQRVVDILEGPCGEPRDFNRLSADVLASIEGGGPLASTAGIDRRVERVTAMAPWLLVVAALLALFELFVRRGGARRETVAAADQDTAAASTGKAA